MIPKISISASDTYLCGCNKSEHIPLQVERINISNDYVDVFYFATCPFCGMTWKYHTVYEERFNEQIN